jgi:hypothetical protein
MRSEGPITAVMRKQDVIWGRCCWGLVLGPGMHCCPAAWIPQSRGQQVLPLPGMLAGLSGRYVL